MSKPRRKKFSLAEAVLGILAVALAGALILAVGGAVVTFAWNVGVVGLAAAAGGTAAKISLWTGMGGFVVAALLSAVLRGTPVTAAK